MKEFLLAILIIILLFWLASEAHADRLVLNVGSYHIGDTNNLNEFNPGIGYEWEKKNIILGAGAYYNSYEKLSVYGTASVENKWVGALVGIASGYEEEADSKLLLFGAGYVKIPITSAIHTRLLIAPGRGLVNEKADVKGLVVLQLIKDF